MKYFFVALLFLCSCGIFKSSTNTQVAERKLFKPQIYFLTFSIKNDSLTNSRSIALKTKRAVEGELKNNSNVSTNSPECLTIEQYEKNSLIDKYNIDHPLFSKIEYVEDGAFKNAKLNLKEKTFFIRVAVKSDSNKIKIFETIKNENRKELITIDL